MKTRQPDSGETHKTWVNKDLLQSSHKLKKIRETPNGTDYSATIPKPTFWDKLLQFVSNFRWWGVNARKAVQIISTHTGRPKECIELYSVEQRRWNLYNYWGEDPCWYAAVKRDDDWCLLSGSWVVAVSKKTGEVLFNGTASDEG